MFQTQHRLEPYQDTCHDYVILVSVKVLQVGNHVKILLAFMILLNNQRICESHTCCIFVSYLFIQLFNVNSLLAEFLMPLNKHNSAIK